MMNIEKISLIIYGTGNVYIKIKEILNWEQVCIDAFLESEVRNKCFEGKRVYTPEEYIEKGKKFGFVICASIYEQEMRKTLEMLHIKKNQIVSGKLELENLLKYPQIYDVSKIIAF